MNNGYDMQPQRFLGSFRGTAWRSTNMAHLKCCVQFQTARMVSEMHLIFTITNFLKILMHHVISSSVRVTFRGTLTSGLLLSLQTILVVPVPARLEHGQLNDYLSGLFVHWATLCRVAILSESCDWLGRPGLHRHNRLHYWRSKTAIMCPEAT